jgi:hypothetical protein
MTEWPDSVPVLFVDGPLAGEVHPAPARAGLPAMMLRVRPGGPRVEVRSAGEQAPGGGWVSYLGLGLARPRSRPQEEPGADPWAFVYSE